MSDNSRFAYIEGRRDIVFDVNAKSILGMIEAVVFDLDGTLTDSIGQILSCTRTTFQYLSLPLPDDKAIMSTIGLELGEALTSLLPEDKKHLGPSVTKYYREIFKSRLDFQLDTLFIGIEPLMKKLRDYDIKIGYASGRSMQGIERTLNATYLGKYCDGICAGSEVPSKPDPTMMHTLCKRLNVKEEMVLGVGDSGLDIKMYQNAGCFSLGVQTGVWSGDALMRLKPDILLEGVGDLTAYFY
ncbi:MAG: HAD family hydrolase [Succinivibrio sp.]|jgi:phosphoglycolate phosphatase|nr:HAD family hydrolase [Succinivibrio sp.]